MGLYMFKDSKKTIWNKDFLRVYFQLFISSLITLIPALYMAFLWLYWGFIFSSDIWLYWCSYFVGGTKLCGYFELKPFTSERLDKEIYKFQAQNTHFPAKNKYLRFTN